MGEPGWKEPKAPKEDCWAIICPVDYCSANIGNPCMNPQGRFTAKAHLARVAKHGRTKDSPEGEFGPGCWSKRPKKDHMNVEDSDSRHNGWSGIGYTGVYDDKGREPY